MALAAFMTCADSGNGDDFDYNKPLGIDTILSRDTLGLHDSVQVVYTFPAGCNHLESLGYEIAADTVGVRLMWNYYYHGAPCAHGSGVDTSILRLDFPSAGGYAITYTKPDSIIAVISTVVR